MLHFNSNYVYFPGDRTKITMTGNTDNLNVPGSSVLSDVSGCVFCLVLKELALVEYRSLD